MAISIEQRCSNYFLQILKQDSKSSNAYATKSLTPTNNYQNLWDNKLAKSPWGIPKNYRSCTETKVRFSVQK